MRFFLKSQWYKLLLVDSSSNSHIGTKPNDIPTAGYLLPSSIKLVIILSYLPPPPMAQVNLCFLSNTSHTVPVYISSPLAKYGVNLAYSFKFK